jgi:hypothetical protein
LTLLAKNKLMKKLLYSGIGFLLLITAFSCNDDNRYVDLNTGKAVQLEKDNESGLMVNAETGKPVELYVDTRTNDTIYGKTGAVINGSVRKSNSGTYTYVQTTEGTYSAKGDVEDGDVKVKAEDGEYKIKSGDYKKKVEKDGDIKIKDGDTKIKIDGKTGERKVKKDDK